MHVCIAGCGWWGTAAARSLIERGDRVTAVVRTLPHAVALMRDGIPAICRDLSLPGATTDLPDDVDVVLATQSAGADDPQAYRRAYLEVTRELLEYAARVSANALVYTGSTGVFGRSDGSTVDESTRPDPASPTATILLEAERLVAGSSRDGFRAIVVRASGLYGPGRTGTIERVRSGALAHGDGDDIWMNFCHRDDAVGILLAAADRGLPGAIYHASDLEPARRGDVIDWIAQRLRMTPPRREGAPAAGGRRGANRRISSEKTREELGLRLAFPNFRKGMAPLTVTLRV